MLWIGTSWKMNGTRHFAEEYTHALVQARTAELEWVQPFVIPPLTCFDVVAGGLANTNVLVGVQNAHWDESGAWTGEVSMAQVADAGAAIVEIGHSERRQCFGETNQTVNLKVKAALRHNLRPLICCGESAEVFEHGESLPFITAQIDAALAGVPDTSQILLAYEPIWAIGENGRPPEHVDLETTFAALSDRYGQRVEAILYGGSVNPANNQEILSIPGVSGLFIGRSAWTASGYLTNLTLASQMCQ
jgi:triosephosphate isomerase